MSHPTRSRPALAVPCAVAVALAVRGAALLAYSGTPFTRRPVGDSTTYLHFASEIAAGRAGELGAFFQAPLYPFVLAALPRVGSWLPVAILQVVAGALACGVLAALAGVVFPRERAAPWLAGLGAALYGPLVYYDLQTLPASLAASIGAAGLLLASRPASGGRALAAGCAFAAAALLTPGMMLLLALAGISVLLDTPRAGPERGARFHRAALFAVGAALLLVPVAVHNRRAGGAALVSSTGINAYIGNNPEATGSFYLPPGSGLDGARLEESARAVAESASGGTLSPAEVSRFWLARAGRFVVSEPGSAVALAGRKALLAVNHYEIPNQLDFQFVTARFLPALSATIPFWVVFSLAGLGAVRALAARSPAGRLVVGAALAGLVVSVLFFATGRYRLPAVPALIVLAAGGLSSWFALVGRRAWGRALAAAAVALLLAAATRLTLVREGDFAFEHALLGRSEAELGNLDGAVLELMLSEETATPDLKASLRLGAMLERRGNGRAALEALRRHLEDHPDDLHVASILDRAGVLPEGPPLPRTPFQAGQELAARGDLEGAERAFRSAVEGDPAHVRALLGLAEVLERRGARRAARRAVQRAARLEPHNPAVLARLAELGS